MSSMFARDIGHFDTLMSAASTRHRVIVSNLANLETPGFTRRDVDFESALAEHLKEGVPLSEAVSGVTPEVVFDHESPARADGNNVDLEKETGELKKNQLLYDLYSRILMMRIQQLQSAIVGR